MTRCAWAIICAGGIWLARRRRTSSGLMPRLARNRANCCVGAQTRHPHLVAQRRGQPGFEQLDRLDHDQRRGRSLRPARITWPTAGCTIASSRASVAGRRRRRAQLPHGRSDRPAPGWPARTPPRCPRMRPGHPAPSPRAPPGPRRSPRRPARPARSARGSCRCRWRRSGRYDQPRGLVIHRVRPFAHPHQTVQLGFEVLRSQPQAVDLAHVPARLAASSWTLSAASLASSVWISCFHRRGLLGLPLGCLALTAFLAGTFPIILRSASASPSHLRTLTSRPRRPRCRRYSS